MFTEILRPNAAGDETSIPYQYPDSTFHWDKVNEAVADGNTTRVYNTYNPYKRDLYNLPAHSVGSGTIKKITVYIRCARGLYGLAKASIKTNDTVVDGATENVLTADYVTYSQEWATNPVTKAAWTRANIDALQIGVSLYAPDFSHTASCTQVYVEVDYTPYGVKPVARNVRA